MYQAMMLSSGSRSLAAIASANGGRSSRRHDIEEMRSLSKLVEVRKFMLFASSVRKISHNPCIFL